MHLPLRALLRPLAPLTLLLVATIAAGCTSTTAKPAPTAEVVVRTSTPEPTATATPSRTPTATRTPTPAAVPPRAAVPPKVPETGRWIEVNVTSYVVRLMDGKQVLKEIGPVAVGKQVDTGTYESTQTGLFNVYVKTAPRTFDAPYNTYIQWWVGFDPAKDNGFHSFLLDKDGKVVDAGTGRISNGCIRTGAAEEIFNFAEIGMPVFVRA